MDQQSEHHHLADQSNRRRRLGDAARLVPVFGTVLLFLPVLWSGAGTTADALIYVFGLWAILIVLMMVLSRPLARTVPRHETADDPGGTEL